MARFRFESQLSDQEVEESGFAKLYKELQENDRHQRENERQVIFEITQSVNTKLDIECSKIEKQLKYHLSKIEKVEVALKALRHAIVAMQQELIEKQAELQKLTKQKQKMEDEYKEQMSELKKQKFDLDFLAADIFNPDRSQFQFQAKRIAKQIELKTVSFQKEFTPISEQFQQLNDDVNKLPTDIEEAISKSKEMHSHIQEAKQTIVRQREILLSKQNLKEELANQKE